MSPGKKSVKILNASLEKQNVNLIQEVKIEKEEEIEDDDDYKVSIAKDQYHYLLEYKNKKLTLIKKENEDSEDESDQEDQDDDQEADIENETNSNHSDEVKSVQEELEHICGKCYNTFSSFQQFNSHRMYCKDNNEMAKNMETMMKNLKSIEQESFELEKNNTCFCCKESWMTAHSGHIRCPRCPKSFKSSPAFERHIFLIHSLNQDAIECETCNAKCPSQTILNVHQKAHQRGKPFACKLCGEEFTRKYHLHRHHMFSGCKSSNVKKVVLCKVCGKEFYRLDNLRIHLKQHLGQEQKTKDYPCPYCDKAFYGTATLNIHMRTHTGERPFKCDLCGNSFPSNPALRKHRRSHTGERPYQCIHCNRFFAAKEVLNRHVKIHTGEKPHECHLCQKRFIQATQLKQHLITHQKRAASISKHCCLKCLSFFASKEELSKHTNEVHESKKKANISCDECPKSFTTDCSLKKHIAKIHTQNGELNTKNSNDRPKNSKNKKEAMICPQCNKTYYTNGGLKRHMMKIHVSNDYPAMSINAKKRKKMEEKEATCNICNKIFENNKSLEFHKLKTHDNINEGEEKESTCRFCFKKFRNSQQFLKHMEDDHGAVFFSVEEQKSNDSEVKNETKTKPILQENTKQNDANVDFVYVVEEVLDIINKESGNTGKKDEVDEIDVSKKEIEVTEISDEEDDYVLINLKSEKEIEAFSPESSSLTEKSLTENISKLLDLLIDKDILIKFGYPEAPVDEVLLKVIKNCGHNPERYDDSYDTITKLRDYVKLLFTVVVDNESIKELLNNHTVDRVICQVLEMAGRS